MNDKRRYQRYAVNDDEDATAQGEVNSWRDIGAVSKFFIGWFMCSF